MDTPPVSLALQALHIPHRVFTHAAPIDSLAQAAAERGQSVSQITRSILFRVSAEEFVLFLAAGAGQVPWKALRKYLNVSRVTMATEEEVLAVTGYKIGAVGPLGLTRPVRILVDARALEQEEISTGSGVSGRAIILRGADLIRALPGAEVVSLGEQEA